MIQESAEDRRRYFRVNDHVALYWQAVQDEASAIETPSALSGTQRLLHDLQSLDSENAALLRVLQEKSRELSQYLHIINAKVDLLTRALILSQASTYYQEYDVYVSASGISFPVKSAMDVGQLIDVHAILLASASWVRFRAKVVWCHQHSQAYMIGTDIVSISEHDQDAIIRHTLHVQAVHRRHEREEQT